MVNENETVMRHGFRQDQASIARLDKRQGGFHKVKPARARLEQYPEPAQLVRLAASIG